MKFRLSTTATVNSKIGTMTFINPMVRVKMTGTTPAGADSQNIHIGLSYYTSEVDFLAGAENISKVLEDVPFDVVLTFTQAEMTTMDTLGSGTFSALLDAVVTELESVFGAGNVARII